MAPTPDDEHPSHAPDYLPDSIPRPDPTDRTLSFTRREIANLYALIKARMDAKDRADELLADSVSRIPTTLDREVARLTQNIDLSLQSIDQRFHAIDTRFIERDGKNATALISIKEAAKAQHDADSMAIAKSDTSVNKQLDALQTLIGTTRETLTVQITALGSRLDKGEAAIAGGRERVDQGRANVNTAVVVAAFVFSVISGLIGFNLSHFIVTTPPPLTSFLPPAGFRLVPETPPAAPAAPR